MNPSFEQFKQFSFAPEGFFSVENPVVKTAQSAHRGLFDAFESAAQANLSLAGDLLELDRQCLEGLYADKPVADKIQAQTDLLVESGQRFVQWTDELRDVAQAYRQSVESLVKNAGEKAAPANKASRKTAKAA